MSYPIDYSYSNCVIGWEIESEVKWEYKTGQQEFISFATSQLKLDSDDLASANGYVDLAGTGVSRFWSMGYEVNVTGKFYESGQLKTFTVPFYLGGECLAKAF